MQALQEQFSFLYSPKHNYFKNNQIGYEFAEAQWKYYCTQARNAANYPDIDRYESFMNQWVRLIPSINRWDLGFEQLNSREDLHRQ